MIYLGEIAALITAFLWAGSSMAFAAAAHRTGTLQVNIDRLLFAFIFLSITIFLFDFKIFLSLEQMGYLAVSGLIGLVFGDTYLLKAYRHIGPRLAMLLMSLAPGLTALLGYIFLDETLSFLGLTGMGITLSGIIMVVVERGEQPSAKYKISKIGIWYGILATIGQAVGLIIARFAFDLGEINGFTATVYRIIPSLIVLFTISLFLKQYNNPVKLYKEKTAAFGFTVLGTVMGPFLGITFSLIAIANAKVGIAATIMSVVPIIMLPLVKIFYKENLSIKAITGAILAVAGVAILFLK